MIHGRMCRETIFIASLSLALSTARNAQPAIVVQSIPQLKLFVYSFPGLSSWMLQTAESEATRMLRPAHIELEWIDCTSTAMAAACQSPQGPTDFIVRFLPKALPHVSASALGIAGLSGDYPTAFIFYDRVLALRTHRRVLPNMLGRVLAHEITHLLLPQQGHSGFGLMRGQWSVDDLRFMSSACLGLSARSVQLMHGEALRRFDDGMRH